MSDKIREAFKVAADAAGIKDGTDRLALWAWWLKAWQAALAQQPAAAVPDGWKLVPVRAIREQVNAVCMHPDLARTLYRNMVEAAPATPAPQEPVDASAMAAQLAPMITEWVDGGLSMGQDWRLGLTSVIARRIRRLIAPPAAEQPDHSGDSIDMVWCACGDGYPALSYGAGFISGSGMCENCDAALPAKDMAAEPDTVKAPRELLAEAESIIESYAESLKASHAPGGDWEGEEAAHDEYELEAGVASKLRALLGKEGK